nr:polysaccharide deacetylase family protein [Armatimonadota bacterium]
GKTNTYHTPEQDLFEPMLSADQRKEMLASGIEFGSHTQHHVHLTGCSPNELREEIAGSRQDLEALLGRPAFSFCYPYGDQDDRVRQAVVDSGYESACSTLKGGNHRGGDPYRLRRINIRADTLLPVFLFKLARARWFNR